MKIIVIDNIKKYIKTNFSKFTTKVLQNPLTNFSDKNNDFLKPYTGKMQKEYDKEYEKEIESYVEKIKQRFPYFTKVKAYVKYFQNTLESSESEIEKKDLKKEPLPRIKQVISTILRRLYYEPKIRNRNAWR
jgi:hypothetical protein